MPTWKKVIVSGSDAILSSVTSSNGFFGTASWASNALTASFLPVGTYNITSSWAVTASQAISSSYALSSSNALSSSYALSSSFATTSSFTLSSSFADNSISASYTPNALVTASVSSNTLTFTKGNGSTFNLTVDTGSGAPGGAQYSIQINDGLGGFQGTNTFKYNDVIEKFSFETQNNPSVTPIDPSTNSNSIENFNRFNIIQINSTPYQFTTSQFPYCKLVPTATTDVLVSFETNAKTSTAPGLTGHSFKCDYSLVAVNGLGDMVVGSRTGTLICSWDENGVAKPILTDTYVTAVDAASGYKLDDAIFDANWNGSTVELSLDTTFGPTNDAIFNGFFTVFSMRL